MKIFKIIGLNSNSLKLWILYYSLQEGRLSQAFFFSSLLSIGASVFFVTMTSSSISQKWNKMSYIFSTSCTYNMKYSLQLSVYHAFLSINLRLGQAQCNSVCFWLTIYQVRSLHTFGCNYLTAVWSDFYGVGRKQAQNFCINVSVDQIESKFEILFQKVV